MKNQKTKLEIITAAQTLFAQKGRSQVSMGDVALACGKSRRTIYNYFINIDFLYYAIIEEELNKMLAQLEIIADDSLPADLKFEKFVTTHFEYIRLAAERTPDILTSFYKNYEEIERARRPIDKREIRIIKKVLDYGRMENIFAVRDTQWTAMLILYAIKGIELPSLNHYIGSHLKIRKDEILKSVLNGLLTRNTDTL